MVTLAPLTTSPLAAVLVVQPTVPLLPWSARHSHRPSPTTLSLLICSVCVAEPTADAGEAIEQGRRVGEVARPGAARADLDEAGPVRRARAEEPPADADAVDV